jgi:uncharacterized YigZ family protein
MTISDSYKTIRSVSRGMYKEKGSKFVSEAHPAGSEPEIRLIIEAVKKNYHDAKHHCFAYLLGKEGDVWRINDDGEPSGTAGKPIMGQIRSFGLTNVLVIVSRYFGGTLLGVSGLINAYKSAAELALSNAEIIDHIIHDFYEITYPFSAMNDVMKIIKEEKINQTEHSFDLECRILIDFRSSAKEKIFARFSRIEGFDYKFLSSK